MYVLRGHKDKPTRTFPRNPFFDICFENIGCDRIINFSLAKYLTFLELKTNLILYHTFQAHIQKFFRAGEVLWSYGTLMNFSSKTKEKRSHREKCWSFSPQILLKLHFEWKIQRKYRHIQGFFSQNQGTFFRFSKKAGEASPLAPPPLLVVRLPFTFYLLPYHTEY